MHALSSKQAKRSKKLNVHVHVAFAKQFTTLYHVVGELQPPEGARPSATFVYVLLCSQTGQLKRRCTTRGPFGCNDCYEMGNSERKGEASGIRNIVCRLTINVKHPELNHGVLVGVETWKTIQRTLANLSSIKTNPHSATVHERPTMKGAGCL